jgi:hypothetical protein
MAAHKIGEILAVSGNLNSLSRTANRLAELERLLSEAVPRALFEATRIKVFRAGTLVVSADNAAVAVKLKQLAPRLLLHIRERDCEVTGIRVEVQPAREAGSRAKKSGKHPIGAATLTEFQNLAEGLAESSLKTALERFVQRHNQKGKTVKSR